MESSFIDRAKQRFFNTLTGFFFCAVAFCLLFYYLQWTWAFLFALFVVGVALLLEGADWVIYTATHLARAFGIPPIVIGLTFVAFGTSLPEFIVTLYASLSGESSLALGNIIGSNIANIGLITGLVAIMSPLAVQSFTVMFETPFMMLASVLFFVLSFRLFNFGSTEYVLGRMDGIILLLFFIMFLVYTYKRAVREESVAVQKEFSAEFGKTVIHLFRTFVVFVIGIICVLLGAKFVVYSGTEIARGLGVNEAFIALTMIALGTSLPELIVSLVAVLKKEYDISVGNIIGSNIINLLFVGGIAAVLRPLLVDMHLIFVDMIVMILFTVFFQIFITTDKKVTRFEGAVLFFGYIAYVSYLVWFMFS